MIESFQMNHQLKYSRCLVTHLGIQWCWGGRSGWGLTQNQQRKRRSVFGWWWHWWWALLACWEVLKRGKWVFSNTANGNWVQSCNLYHCWYNCNGSLNTSLISSDLQQLYSCCYGFIRYSYKQHIDLSTSQSQHVQLMKLGIGQNMPCTVGDIA